MHFRRAQVQRNSPMERRIATGPMYITQTYQISGKFYLKYMPPNYPTLTKTNSLEDSYTAF